MARTRPRGHEQRARRALARLFSGGGAHADPATVLSRFPPALRGAEPRTSPHTPWELLEHLRITQQDILAFTLDPEHDSPEWPRGYWAATRVPPDARAWQRSARAFLRDLRQLRSLALDPRRDLFGPLPGTSTSLLGQLLLAASHASYHLGQLVLLQKELERPAHGRRADRRSRP